RRNRRVLEGSLPDTTDVRGRRGILVSNEPGSYLSKPHGESRTTAAWLAAWRRQTRASVVSGETLEDQAGAAEPRVRARYGSREVLVPEPPVSRHSGRCSAIVARSMLKAPYHSAGSAIIAATGTVQRRSVVAPQTTTTTATGRRASSGIGTAAHVPSRPDTVLSTVSQSDQAFGMNTAEATMIMPVATSAVASWFHSRRTANHSRPTPGVTFVSSTNDHAAGQRKPTTTATAIRISMFPPASSISANTTP